ncbi:MAG: helix-turn-helix transcriptional regulator [Rhizobiales bacterium]|nr:helix-turn-helix transcriptional regulator [Hyphomicrobiales bacterium]
MDKKFPSPGPYDFKTSTLDDVHFPHAMSGNAWDWPASFENNPHHHNCGQLVFASNGIMDVMTEAGTWVVPPQRAVWMPPGRPHVIKANTLLAFRTVYIEADLASGISHDCFVLHVTPLLRELVLEIVRLSAGGAWGKREESIASLIGEEVVQASRNPSAVHLPMPKDSRVQPIVRALLADPADARSREDWAGLVGASGRTIDRVFAAQCGMSFRAWRRQAILLEALRRLADGQSVSTVAFDLGYDSVSSFIAMFKKSLGVTPARMFG